MPEPREILSPDEFYRRALAGRKGVGPGAPAPGACVVRSTLTATVIKAAPGAEDDRRMTFACATGNTNRNGWRWNPKGWELDNFTANPVFLWAHGYSNLPLGRVERVWVEGDMLMATVLFTPAELSSFNNTVYEMYRQGFLNAVSVGVIPLDYEFVETEAGWDIMCARQELLELSGVPVPAEPLALRQAAAAGIDVGPLRAWARQLLDEPRYLIEVPDDVPLDQRRELAKQFVTFHQGAKVLVHSASFKIVPLPGTDTEPLRGTTAAAVQADVAAITDTHGAGAAPEGDAGESPTAGTAAAASPAAPAERTFRGTPEWRRRQLENLN